MAGSAVVKLACALVMCIVVAAPLAEAITCGQVSGKVAPCISYLTGPVASPSPACCIGIKALASGSTADKRTACGCLKSASARIRGINFGKASGLPGKCGVSIPYAISPSTNCNAIH